MRRLAASLVALVCVLAPTAVLLVATPARAAALKLRRATGTVSATGSVTLTIQTSGRRMGVINALTSAATAVAKGDYSYVWGGGHAEAGVASLGIKGPGYTGHTAGFDCSGSVAAVLAGAGLWSAGSSVPNDAGVISELLAEHIIARGAGTPPDEVTLYDDPGVHIFMNIDGRFFGTSDGAGGGNRNGGAGWLDDGAPDASSRRFKRYHVVASVLRDRTSYGHSLTFQTTAQPAVAAGAQVGDKVRVSYTETATGTMTVRDLTYVGSATAHGTVTSVAAGGGSFAIQTVSGSVLTFSTGIQPALAYGLQAGDTVQVTYTKKAGSLTARAVTVTAPPAPTTTAPPAPSPSSGDGSGGDPGTTAPGGGDGGDGNRYGYYGWPLPGPGA